MHEVKHLNQQNPLFMTRT